MFTVVLSALLMPVRNFFPGGKLIFGILAVILFVYKTG